MQIRLFHSYSVKSLVAGILFAAASFALGGCGSSKSVAVKHPSAREYTREIEANYHLDKQQKLVIEEAFSWLGTPYTHAMQDKGVGTDCSGMVMAVYRDALGSLLPLNSAKQAEFCERIEAEEARIGDLVFFATGKNPERVSHVGIVVDPDNFIHASTSKGVVVSALHTPYYASRLIMYGRVPAHRADNR